MMTTAEYDRRMDAQVSEAADVFRINNGERPNDEPLRRFVDAMGTTHVLTMKQAGGIGLNWEHMTPLPPGISFKDAELLYGDMETLVRRQLSEAYHAIGTALESLPKANP